MKVVGACLEESSQVVVDTLMTPILQSKDFALGFLCWLFSFD